MKIVISCSIQYRDLIEEIIENFKKIGITPLFPNIDLDKKITTSEEVKNIALEHYRAIDEADVFYLLTPKNYIGNSCKLELGYAIAKNKPIYFSEPTNIIEFDCYVKEFIATNELEKFLK